MAMQTNDYRQAIRLRIDWTDWCLNVTDALYLLGGIYINFQMFFFIDWKLTL